MQDLLIRISGRDTLTPQGIIGEHREVSEANDGRLLFTTDTPLDVAKVRDTVDNVLLRAPNGDFLLGRLIGIGGGNASSGYTGPDSKGVPSGFVTPDIWANENALYWLALDQVIFGEDGEANFVYFAKDEGGNVIEKDASESGRSPKIYGEIRMSEFPEDEIDALLEVISE